MLVCVVGSIHTVSKVFKITNGNIEIIFESDYLDSSAFHLDNHHTIDQLADLIETYKSEAYILEGHTVSDQALEARVEEELWNNGDEVVSEIDVTDEMKKEMNQERLEDFKRILKNLEKKKEPLYYVTDGEHTFTNTTHTKVAQFEKYPVYYISEGYESEMYPNTLDSYTPFYRDTQVYRLSNSENIKLYLGYTEDYIETVSKEWSTKKAAAMQALYYFLGYVALFFLAFLYLVLTTGRKSFTDKTVYMQPLDKLYVEIIIILVFGLIGMWYVILNEYFLYDYVIVWLVYLITLPFVALVIPLLLSMIRHMKNKTIIKHSITYISFRWLYRFVKDTYDSGSVGVKIVVLVILYPIIAVASLFLFPVTIAVAAWIALKKVQTFKKIQDGARLMREGNIQEPIDITGNGEFANLAANINGINEGFKQAVHNELKNERMKTELITNVSHDIRTPLTSLITYTDLLKRETDPEKRREYIDILEQKSERLKVLTDDLFAAAKASSGDIPVNLQEIDIVALMTQGIGEVSEEITAKNLDFKFNYPADKIDVIADGKLLWRSIENILSNIFNYALENSRVYIDITYENEGILLSFKNISKYELNITEDELMERFKRGDESRTSQGSGLGLSITKSLIENQKGTFEVNIDGDLFKSIIYLPMVEKAS